MMIDTLKTTHNPVSLPKWGPYTKNYIGISHIPDIERGLRFDLSVFPGLYRRKTDVPNVMFESDYHPWEASGDLRYFCFRHELEWKDQVYTDISYSYMHEHSRLIRAQCVNNTALPQQLVLHFMASLHFPALKEYAPNDPLLPCVVSLPEHALWVDALDYDDLQFAVPRPDDNLVGDGKLRGEIRANGCVNGSCLARNFGLDAGDSVSYRVTTQRRFSHALLLLRYRLEAGQSVEFRLQGLVRTEIALCGGSTFVIQEIPLGNLELGEHWLTLTSQGGAPLELDGWALVESASAKDVQFRPVEWHPVPEMLDGPQSNSLLLKYRDIDQYYGISWEWEHFDIRQFFCRDLDTCFKKNTNNHVQTEFYGNGEGHFTNIFLRPIVLAPHSSRQVYGLVCSGTRPEVECSLAEFAGGFQSYEELYQAARKQKYTCTSHAEGESYCFSQERMAATTLSNVVYPVYTRRAYIMHNTPGRWWDCLYTWDSGFIGLGLLELDKNRAIECLNAYTTPPGDQSAFIHHGSLVPVQHYLFLELWNRAQSQEWLTYFYPRLRQYYQFMAGRSGSSTTRALKSNLLKTWDYFYNSGGWDDYPAQVYVHKERLEATVTPVITTAHAIRIAKILCMAARALDEDPSEFEQDIALFSNALHTIAWDEQDGVFGYVCHDAQGHPTTMLRHESGANFNLGLDGVYPLMAGICSDVQEQRLLAFLMSEAHLWSPCGLSAVDQSAPYYRQDGYWNGTVWMAHQWFFWKTMLDLNQPEFAWRIAHTGLETWRCEVEASYNCMEHFVIASGRGAGWHQFGGLSTPVISWFNAYFVPGRITVGFNVWIKTQAWNEEKSALTAMLAFYGDAEERPLSLLVCMNADYRYGVFWNEQKIPCSVRHSGLLEIAIKHIKAEGILTIQRC